MKEKELILKSILFILIVKDDMSFCFNGQVAKLANALALGASAARLVGSSPTLPTYN